MRLNINLASKPYIDVQRVLLRWGMLVVLLAVCTAALATRAITSWRESRDVNARIAVLRNETAALDQQRSQSLAILQSPENSSVVDNSKFLNALIARKSFSWTRVFMQMEEIMPPRLHVLSIAPDLIPHTNNVQVTLKVAGTSREAAVELVRRLERSPVFRDARISQETLVTDHKSEDSVSFDLTAIYVPQTVPEAHQLQPAAAAKAREEGGKR